MVRVIPPFYADFEQPALLHADEVIEALMQILDAHDEAWRDLPQGVGRARFVADPAGERGWRTSLMQHDDLTRVISNLRSKWVRQLGTVDGPTLLVVLTNNLFFQLECVQEEVHHVTASLRAILPQRRMLGAVLLHEEPHLPAPCARDPYGA